MTSRLFFGTVVALGVAFAAMVHANPGDLDLTFGTNGRVVQGFFDRDHAVDMVVQPDGKFVVVGTATAHQWDDEDFLVARFHPDGQLDTSFGNMGMARLDLLGDADQASSVALQVDGKIVVAGSVKAIFSGPNTEKFALVRYTADGALDTSFGSGGRVITDFFGLLNRANALVVQPDGKIVAGGMATSVSSSESADFALARYAPDGSLDPEFGTGGMVVTIISEFPDIIDALALQPDGKIVAGGTTRHDNNFYRGDFALARYNADGSLDKTFGSGGQVVTDVTNSNTLIDEIRSLIIGPDGKVIAAGRARSLISSGDKFALARYNTDGSLDARFGSGGKTATAFFNRSAAHAAVLQQNGKIILAGEVNRPYDNFGDMAMARYNRNGTLDITFGDGGRKIESLSPDGTDVAADIVLLPDGRIIAAGILSNQGNTTYDFVLARFFGDALITAQDF